jgi:predicted PurR-regulated permease PerM
MGAMRRLAGWAILGGMALAAVVMVVALFVGFYLDYLGETGVDSHTAFNILQVIFAICLVLLFTALATGYSLRPLFAAMESRMTRRNAIETAVILLLYPAVFAILCAALFTQFGGFAGVPSHYPQTSSLVIESIKRIVDFVPFSYSWFLDSVTFNASQLWAWLPTPIQPTTWWANTLVWLFSLLSDVVLVTAFLNLAGVFWIRTARRQSNEQQG